MRPFAFVLLALCGCDSGPDRGGYETTVVYPMRADPLVADLSRAAAPAKAFPGGQLDASLLALGKRGGAVHDPLAMPAELRLAVDRILAVHFGTPAAPMLAGAESEKLAAGSRVYKRHCVTCHGLAGDGRGPTSLWVHPPARDFRRGQFKFTSVPGGLGRASHADIRRSIRTGIGGASMPSFAMLPEEDIDAVAWYVRHLSVRGEAEYEMLVALHQHDAPTELDAYVQDRTARALKAWADADAAKGDPADVPSTDPQPAATLTPDSLDRLRRGHGLFTGPLGGCAACHVDYGRHSAWRSDVWGVPTLPPNLTATAPRGGADGLSLFRRLRCGIAPSGMPPLSLDVNDSQAWDLVAFLRALPVPEHLPVDVRAAVYPGVR